MAGRLGYCAADRTREVLRGDEVRACWQAPADAAEPFTGLFGELSAAPRPPALPASARRMPGDRPPAPTPAVAAERRWAELMGTPYLAPPVPLAPMPPAQDPLPMAHGRPGDPTDEPPTPVEPTAQEPAPLPVRWRHRAPDDQLPPTVDPPLDPSATVRRPPALTLLPATLANRLRRARSTGRRVAAATSEPMVAVGPGRRPADGSVGQPIVPARAAPGRLVEAPSVPPTGAMLTLGDQLRRAEQVRQARAQAAPGTLLDHQGDGRDRGRDPGA